MQIESGIGAYVFCSYAQKDEGLARELKMHLSVLRRQGLITAWFDHQIEESHEEGKGALPEIDKAQVILLLISPDFMASDYSHSAEVQRAVQRHESRETRVLPILLYPVNLEGTPLEKFPLFPLSGKPVMEWDDPNEAFYLIARAIRRIVKDSVLEREASDTDPFVPPVSRSALMLRSHEKDLDYVEHEFTSLDLFPRMGTFMPNDKKYYTKEEVMKLLDKPSTTFYREVNAGIIPSELEGGRERGRKFPKEAIDAYVEMLQHGGHENLKFVPSSNSDLWARVQSSRKIYSENDTVSYRKMLQWKEANKDIFMSVKAEGRLVGSVSLMPVVETTIHALLNNKILEKEIPIGSIRDWYAEEISVYIPTMGIVASGNKRIDSARGRFLIRETLKWALSLRQRYDIKNWYALGITAEGAKLLQHIGFTSIDDRIAKRLGFRLIKNHRPGFVLEETALSGKLLKGFQSKLEG
jgi:TIR domain